MANPYGVSDDVYSEAVRRFAWAFPPRSDEEDAARKREGRKPRCGGDWEPTRRACIEDVMRQRFGFPRKS